VAAVAAVTVLAVVSATVVGVTPTRLIAVAVAAAAAAAAAVRCLRLVIKRVMMAAWNTAAVVLAVLAAPIPVVTGLCHI
jgi:hypothetical protein